MKNSPPLGIRILANIYLLNAILYLVCWALFSSRILIFNKEVNTSVSYSIHLLLISIPLYLYLRLKRLKKDALFLAMFFHLFFIVNGGMSLLEYYGFLSPIINITAGRGPGLFSSPKLYILIVSGSINIFILGYLVICIKKPIFIHETKGVKK